MRFQFQMDLLLLPRVVEKSQDRRVLSPLKKKELMIVRGSLWSSFRSFYKGRMQAIQEDL